MRNRIIATVFTMLLLASLSRDACSQLSPVGFIIGDVHGRPRGGFCTLEPQMWFFVSSANSSGKSGSPRVDISIRNEAGMEVTRLTPSRWPAASHRQMRACLEMRALLGKSGVLAKPLMHYQGVVYIDGREVTRKRFQIRTLQGQGAIQVTTLHVQDEHGRRRHQFYSYDRGAYVRVGLVNRSGDRVHEHLLQTVWIGPNGEWLHTLGGVLRVNRGDRLDGIAFPRVVDELGHDGLRIRGTPVVWRPGQYRILLLVDGTVVGETVFWLDYGADALCPTLGWGQTPLFLKNQIGRR